MDAVKASPVLAGYCWTQLTDTLQEANGLCDENRVPKLPVETLKDLKVYVNKAAAERMGITVPADLLDGAEVVG